MSCPSENAEQIDQSTFWDGNNVNWDHHRIGWAIAGGCATLTVVISCFSVLSHCRNYHNPPQQRQILRILYLPPVYAIISFFSYRFFRSYTYYSLIEVAYEAIAMSAFLLLIVEYVASTAASHDADKAIERKDKKALPLPFCCWRYRPTKAYFMYTVKWSVMQYVIVRPLISIIAIICEAHGVLCESGAFSIHFADVYLEAIDFVSISIALYGLFLFYGLTKDELKRRRPLAKFLCIKLIVMFTFYQSFVFSALKGRVIHETPYWTETNITNGLNALGITIEMVFFSAGMMWAYPAREYRKDGIHTSVFRPLLDSFNYGDFAREIWSSCKFFLDYARGVPTAHGHGHRGASHHRVNFAEAFGVDGAAPTVLPTTRGGSESRVTPRPRDSDDENIRLEPYPPGRTSL